MDLLSQIDFYVIHLATRVNDLFVAPEPAPMLDQINRLCLERLLF